MPQPVAGCAFGKAARSRRTSIGRGRGAADS